MVPFIVPSALTAVSMVYYASVAWKIFSWVSGIAFAIELTVDIIDWVNYIPDEFQTTTTELPKPIYIDVFFKEIYMTFGSVLSCPFG